jgi:hypothetical protein
MDKIRAFISHANGESDWPPCSSTGWSQFPRLIDVFVVGQDESLTQGQTGWTR